MFQQNQLKKVMFKGTPYLNRNIKKSQQKRSMQYHMINLHHARARTSSLQQSSWVHINKKKGQMQRQIRYTQIQRQNRILLSKISSIMGKYQIKTQSQHKLANRSLNSQFRKRQLQNIQLQNAKLLKRLYQKKSQYDVDKFKQIWKKQKYVIKNLSNYPFIIRDKKAKRGSLSEIANRQSKHNTIQLCRLRTIDGVNFLITIKMNHHKLQIIGDTKQKNEIKVIQIQKKSAIQFIQLQCNGKIQKMFDLLRYNKNNQILYLVPKDIITNDFNQYQHINNSEYYLSSKQTQPIKTHQKKQFFSLDHQHPPPSSQQIQPHQNSSQQHIKPLPQPPIPPSKQQNIYKQPYIKKSQNIYIQQQNIPHQQNNIITNNGENNHYQTERQQSKQPPSIFTNQQLQQPIQEQHHQILNTNSNQCPIIQLDNQLQNQHITPVEEEKPNQKQNQKQKQNENQNQQKEKQLTNNKQTTNNLQKSQLCGSKQLQNNKQTTNNLQKSQLCGSKQLTNNKQVTSNLQKSQLYESKQLQNNCHKQEENGQNIEIKNTQKKSDTLQDIYLYNQQNNDQIIDNEIKQPSHHQKKQKSSQILEQLIET